MDTTPCDICRSIWPETNNEMIFCEICKVCVHQHCYGVREIPEGPWKCQTCASGILPNLQGCRFCTSVGGAMVPVRSPGKKHWAHVSCTWWIPGVSINNPIKMDYVIGIPLINKSRWNLRCSICRKGKGTTCCIQCFHKRCTVAFHVTCGFKNGLKMDVVDVEDAPPENIRFYAFCKNHSNDTIPLSSPKKKRRSARAVSESDQPKKQMKRATSN